MLWQLLRNVAVHLVTLAVWLLCGIDVEACAAAEVVRIVFTRVTQTTRAGVWVYYRDALLRSLVLEEALLGTIVACAGQACKVEEDRDWLRRAGLRWEVEVEFRFGGEDLGLFLCVNAPSMVINAGKAYFVLQLQKLAAEAVDGLCGFERHCGECAIRRPVKQIFRRDEQVV